MEGFEIHPGVDSGGPENHGFISTHRKKREVYQVMRRG